MAECNCGCSSNLPIIKQGDAYDVQVSLTFNEEPIDDGNLDLIEEIEFTFGDLAPMKFDPADIYDTTAGAFLVPLTQEQTFGLEDGKILVDCRVQFRGGDVVGVSRMVRVFVREALSWEILPEKPYHEITPPSPSDVLVLPLTVTANGTYTAPSGSAYSPVVVNVPQGSGGDVTVEPLTITSNGTYTAPSGKAYSPVVVNTPTSEDGEEVWFDDRNVYVQDYMTASEGYTAANRSTLSVISQYASTSILDQDAPRPFLGQYNLEPAEENEVGAWTVTTLGKPPRMLKLENVWNVRDCGGYSADGGKVAYGKLFRGSRLNNATSSDLALLAEVGIKLDLDIRDAGNAANGHIPNADYLNVPLTNAYAQMIQSEATAAANAVKAAMNAIVANKPVYVHCASGADRTGCICAMLEAVLGMSDADIDRDFELTCFSDTENLTGHHRNGGSWTAFWAALPTNQGSAKLNVAKFLRDNGATTALLNSFRQAMIDGTPSDIDVQTRSITNNLTGCATSNNASSVVLNDPYSATITPNTGYTLLTLTVTMGGVDITSTAVDNGVITIASVTGNVVITAFAEAQTSYTNLVRTSQERTSSAVFNGIGYKNGYYISSGNESANSNDCLIGLIPYHCDNSVDPTDILYIKGYTGAADASHTRMHFWKANKTDSNGEYNGFIASTQQGVFDIEVLGTGYYKLSPKSGVHHNYAFDYIQFSFAQPDGSGIIITKNEPIE